MSDAKTKWNEAGATLGGVGAKLKAHYDQQEGSASPEDQQQVKEALNRLSDALTAGFEALGAAVKDPAVRDDVKHAATTLSEAIAATFAEAAGDVKQAYDRHKAKQDPPADTPV